MYALSFSESFFYSDNESDEPSSVNQAIGAMTEESWNRMAQEVFHCDPEQLSPDTVMEKILKTNTCYNLDSPVEVLLDRDGYFTLLVYGNGQHDD